MIWDYFYLALKGVLHRKLRSWLTILGVLIGVAAVVSLISVGQGMQTSIEKEVNKIGADKITVVAGSGKFGPIAGSITTAKLTDKDLKVILETKGVEKGAGVLFRTSKIKYGKKIKHINVMGSPTDESRSYIEELPFFQIESGRQFSEKDKNSNVAILGYKIAKEKFGKEIKVGDKIYINDEEFKIIGVQKKAGTGTHDLVVRIPLEKARTMFGTEEFTIIFAKVQKGLKPGDVADKIKKRLRKLRNVEKGKEDFSVETAEDMVKRLTIVLNVVQVVFTSIAAISLLVGCIGIMNTMYVSILERKREIGVMKAIGAKNYDVWLVFLIESAMLGLVGGIIGIAFGFALAKLAEFIIVVEFDVELFRIEAGFSFILIALLISALIGGQASKMNPVECLRE